MPGQCIAARKMKLQRAIAGRENRYMSNARSIRCFGKDHSETNFGNHRLERSPLVGVLIPIGRFGPSKGGIGMHYLGFLTRACLAFTLCGKAFLWLALPASARGRLDG